MKRQEFKEWFEYHGESFLRGWLRAKQDGNQETFTNWIVGEYEYFIDDLSNEEDYRVPYFGICDSPSNIERLIDS